MAFTEDLSYVVDTTTGFAVVGTLNGSSTLTGIFDNDYAESGRIASANPTFTVRTADYASPAQGDALVISGTTYAVRSWEPDGTGITVVQLEKA